MQKYITDYSSFCDAALREMLVIKNTQSDNLQLLKSKLILRSTTIALEFHKAGMDYSQVRPALAIIANQTLQSFIQTTQQKLTFSSMNNDFYTVGIGASAGGLDALQLFFKQIPTGLNAAFVVVTHLQRDFKSVMNLLLSGCTMMPVVRAEHNIPLEPGKIYVLVENTILTLHNKTLIVKERDEQILNTAVNTFLESLAKDVGEKAVAIILSGGGDDGLKGAKAIHAAGGLVMVQDPASALVDGMPKAIINYDHPEAILSPAQLAKNLARHLSNIRSLDWSAK